MSMATYFWNFKCMSDAKPLGGCFDFVIEMPVSRDRISWFHGIEHFHKLECTFLPV